MRALFLIVLLAGCAFKDCGFSPDVDGDEEEVSAGLVFQCSF